MKKFAHFSIGLLIGAVLTGVTVLLITPVSGKQLQEEIKNKVDEIVYDVKEASELRQKELKSELETLRQGKTIQIESVK